jgi:hypothetical protein
MALREVPEDHDLEARAKALEAVRMRLDPAQPWPSDGRSWPAIARALGYPSGNAARRAAWRTFNRTSGKYLYLWDRLDAFKVLAEAVGMNPDDQRVRRMLRQMDLDKRPEDKDPPKPKRPVKTKTHIPLTKSAVRRMFGVKLAAELAREFTFEEDPEPATKPGEIVIDADPDPQALMSYVFPTNTTPRQPRRYEARSEASSE